jgi:outer membrane protein OmpA-like peptidoglycan-associated protein
MKSIHVIIGGFLASIFLIFLCISVNAEKYYIELGLGEQVERSHNSMNPSLPFVSEANSNVESIKEEIEMVSLGGNLTESKKEISLLKESNNTIAYKTQESIETEENRTVVLNDKNMSMEENISKIVKIAPIETSLGLIERGSFKYEMNKSNNETNLSSDTPLDKEENLQEKVSQLLKKERVTFAKNSGKIRLSGKKVLDKIAKLLHNKKNIKIEIEGHTDAGGRKKINQKISQMRANRVRKYLIKKGVLSKNIKAKGWGESKLLFPKKPYNYLNRRVEIYIKKEEK